VLRWNLSSFEVSGLIPQIKQQSRIATLSMISFFKQGLLLSPDVDVAAPQPEDTYTQCRVCRGGGANGASGTRFIAIPSPKLPRYRNKVSENCDV
jgi:hypothetical protein